MLEAIAKHVSGKVVTAVLAVSSIGTVIYFYRNPDDLRTVWLTLKYALAWIGFTLALPWATFFVPRWVATRDSNAAAALMLLGYVFADALVAFWLMGGVGGHGALVWVVLLLGFLSAAVYNFKVCEYQVDHFEEGF